MKRKMTILLFGLLLAVGWTSSAQAQELARYKDASSLEGKSTPTLETKGHPGTYTMERLIGINQGPQFRAPLRSQNFNQTSPVIHTKSWYQALAPITWDGGSQNITEPFTTADGMIALLKRIYTDKTIPGFKYSENRRCDIPYQTIEHGWNIVGTQYNEGINIEFGSGYIDVLGIRIKKADGTVLDSWTAPQTNGASANLPSSWIVNGTLHQERVYSSGQGRYYYAYYMSQVVDGQEYGGGVITIPASALANTTGYVTVEVQSKFTGDLYNTSPTTDNTAVYIGNETFKYDIDSAYTNAFYYSLPKYIPGTITTPPDSAGYTVMLVKLQDEFPEGDVPEYTEDEDALKTYFTNYVKEIQLLTDGMRVDEGHDDAGTVFAYTGDVNRFYFIGKGKLAYYRALNAAPFDRAPFYCMYEEFSPYVAGGQEDHSDFYEKMRQGTTYPIIHDCEGVIYLNHYFSMSGAQGVTENRVNCLVFYIPDNRGDETTWQSYEPAHQPTIGMYMIDLYADVDPSETTPDYYTVTVNWFDNLDVITHVDDIPQIYKLYEIRYNEETGKNDTTLVYEGPDTEWSIDYPAGDPNSYDLHYFVIGSPADATNPDTFFAKSNTDDVTIPGKNDFIGLQWIRYESDYVAKNQYDPERNEVNYYRNWLSPHKLSTQGQTGINAGNVGTAGRTLTLYREDTPIIDLELVMSGNEAYYRIKYRNRNENQQVEHGYDENTGEMTRNTNK